MPRALSLNTRRKLARTLAHNPNHLGAQLGRLMLELNVPARAVGAWVGVTEDTIYRWINSNHHDLPAERFALVRNVVRDMSRKLPYALQGSVSARCGEFNKFMRRRGG